jgi:dTDP-4-amino-4,6-dideoxygalactose transaminase
MLAENKYKIYLSPPHQSGQEIEYLQEVLKSNWLAPGGQFVHAFENGLTKITGRKFCVALNSGTAAIHMALKVLGVGPGDHVLCQTFSFVATANPIAYLGAVPVFIDSEWETWNMDPNLLEHAIQDLSKHGIKPKAIIYAHIYGFPARINEILAIAKKYEIPVIEDAAEALGTKINDKLAGNFGDLSVISFNGNKVITTSGGGVLLTNKEQWAEKARSLASQARDKAENFAHTDVGYNYQMSNLTAAVGLSQLPKLNSWVEKKRQIFEFYSSFFQDLGDYKLVHEHNGEYSNRWLSTFLAPDKETRDRIIVALKINEIESRHLWQPLHLLGIYPSQKAYISNVSGTLFKFGFCLPSGVGLQQNEQSVIMRIIALLY